MHALSMSFCCTGLCDRHRLEANLELSAVGVVAFYGPTQLFDQHCDELQTEGVGISPIRRFRKTESIVLNDQPESIVDGFNSYPDLPLRPSLEGVLESV